MSGSCARSSTRLAETDRREDELYGDARGDELPEQLRTPEGRRAAFREAKLEFDAEREAAGGRGRRFRAAEADDEDPGRALSWTASGSSIASMAGAAGCARGAANSMSGARAGPADRPLGADRLQSQAPAAGGARVELEANAAYETYRARGVMSDGRRFGDPPKPYSRREAAGTINTTDHDSRIVRTEGQPASQGYNAQAAVNENQIIIAAEVTVDSPDFGHLEPMVDATLDELEAGCQQTTRAVLADAGYWHKSQMENVVDAASRC